NGGGIHTADHRHFGWLAGQHRFAEAGRHDYPGRNLLRLDLRPQAGPILEPFHLEDPGVGQACQDLTHATGDLATVFIGVADRGDAALAERGAEDEVEDEGEHERGEDAEHERRTVPHAQEHVFDRDAPSSPHQSRRALPVRWRNTASRSGSWTSTPTTVIPLEVAALNR